MRRPAVIPGYIKLAVCVAAVTPFLVIAAFLFAGPMIGYSCPMRAECPAALEMLIAELQHRAQWAMVWLFLGLWLLNAVLIARYVWHVDRGRLGLVVRIAAVLGLSFGALGFVAGRRARALEAVETGVSIALVGLFLAFAAGLVWAALTARARPDSQPAPG